MILDDNQTTRLPEVFAMVDGCFDPIHRGHIEYFQLAHDLGVPVLCNAASDTYILSRKGRPPLLPQKDRLIVLDSIRYIAFTCLAEHGTAWALNKYRPRYYVKGLDWQGKLPADQVAICAELGIDIVHVDCARDSSTRILGTFLSQASLRQAV